MFFFAACEFVDLNRAVFDLAAVLRAESNLKTPDALHLAAAMHAGCDEFCTNDRQLIRIATPRIKVIDWDILLQN